MARSADASHTCDALIAKLSDADLVPERAVAFPQTALAAQVWVTESKGETLDDALGKPFTSEMSTLPAARDPMCERAVLRGAECVAYVIIYGAFRMFCSLVLSTDFC